MIDLGRIDHVCLRVAELDEASARWQAQFGLHEAGRDGHRVLLACDDEPYALELRTCAAGEEPGLDHVGYELRDRCSLEDARAHLDAAGVECEDDPDGGLALHDLEGNGVEILPFRMPESRLTAHTRPVRARRIGAPRKLGHVNFLTARREDQIGFYTDVLGMRLSDYLGDAGVWFHINSDHHVMALVDTGVAHFHHLAFDVVDIGQMRDTLDHLGRHGRWLGWGPTRHGIAGNIASYVRIVEEHCFVEIYCDMEQLQEGHVPRNYPDDRFSSNTWGPLPPRSYFRFDEAAIESERESLETRGVMLGDPA